MFNHQMGARMLVDNLHEVQDNIKITCEKAGRKQEEVTLITVSKTKPISMIKELYEDGIRKFGENKVQDLVDKYEALPKDIEWHMIGHLQRNKVKYIVDKVAMIHSVDSLRLAEEISKEASKKQLTVSILVEVNVANEESKFGYSIDETEEAIRLFSKLPGLKVKGLMTSAPYVEDAGDNRKYFRLLKQLCVDINSKNIDNVCMDSLSMGMTNDYIIAIEEGATLVRVGTAIFGERNYNK